MVRPVQGKQRQREVQAFSKEWVVLQLYEEGTSCGCLYFDEHVQDLHKATPHHTAYGRSKQAGAYSEINDAEYAESGGHESPSKKQALLSTAVVQVYGGSSGPRLCRALIDSCSQKHFITERFANTLAITKERAHCQVSGLQDSRTKIDHLVRATVKSGVGDFSAELELLVTPTIIDDLPPESIDITSWKIPRNIKLADPTFHSAGQIDMLLGAELFWDLIKSGKIALAENLPSLRDTELGWVVGGVLPSRTTETSPFCGVLAKEIERSARF